MQRSVQDPSLDVWSPTSAQLALISAGLSDLEALIENYFVRGSSGSIKEMSIPPQHTCVLLAQVQQAFGANSEQAPWWTPPGALLLKYIEWKSMAR